MQVDMAILSILAVVIVFVIGAFKQNPLHLGILGMFVAFVIGKAAGIADTTIMGFFPTTLFVVSSESCFSLRLHRPMAPLNSLPKR